MWTNEIESQLPPASFYIHLSQPTTGWYNYVILIGPKRCKKKIEISVWPSAPTGNKTNNFLHCIQEKVSGAGELSMMFPNSRDSCKAQIEHMFPYRMGIERHRVLINTY